MLSIIKGYFQQPFKIYDKKQEHQKGWTSNKKSTNIIILEDCGKPKKVFIAENLTENSMFVTGG